MFSFSGGVSTRESLVTPPRTPIPATGQASGSGDNQAPPLHIPQHNNNSNQQQNSHVCLLPCPQQTNGNNNNMQNGKLLHQEMRHVGQHPNATLLGHFNNAPVNRQRGRAANRTVHTRNIDMAYFIDSASNRQQIITNNLVNHQVAVAN